MSSPDPRSSSPSTGLAVASLVLGVLSIFTCGLLGLGAFVGICLGVVALIRANREPAAFGGKGLATAGVVTNAVGCLMLPVLGIVAAIVIPSLSRARVSANESVAIGDVRTVISAQMAFESAGGNYGPLECLVTPSAPGCVTNYPATGPVLLDSAIGSLADKNGYARRFVPGRPKPTAMSPNGIDSFCYSAYPLDVGRTGARSFAGDQTGRVCVDPEGGDLCSGPSLPADCMVLGW